MDQIKFKINSIDKDKSILKLELLINNNNILEWKKNNEIYTTQYNLEDIMDYLILNTIEFANNADDFPYNIKADNILQLSDKCYSLEFDNENEEIDFFENVHNYFYNHSIGHASGGAIIANLYFRHIENYMEIAWDNYNEEQDFTFKKGVARINIDEYKEELWNLKKQYDKLLK